MNIDVLINSCARPDIMEISLNTFRERIKTKHNLRYVLLEDKVKNPKRQELGRQWIEQNSHSLDKVVYADKKMGPGKFFAAVVSLCESDYFFHLEDDNEFIVDVDIDHVLDFMVENQDVVEIMLARSVKSKNYGKKIKLPGIKLTEFKLFSVATGLFNTLKVKEIIDVLGWENRLHEFKTLTPTSDRLNLKRYVLGHNDIHYRHVGAEKGYRKGAWK